MIKLDNLSFSYKGNQVLKSTNFSLETGEIAFIQGKSGSGKSTFLKILAGQMILETGSLFFNGQEIDFYDKEKQLAYQKELAFSSQDMDTIIYDRSIYQNVSYFLEYKGLRNEIIKEKVTDLLESLGIFDLSQKFPDNISGGELARLSIANAIIKDKKLLLLDEPTANLDPRTMKNLLELLVKLKNQGKSIVITSHDNILLSSNLGKIYQLKNGKLNNIGEENQ